MKTSLTKPRNKTSSTKITRRLQNRRALRRFGPSTNLRAGAERTQQDEGQLTGEGPRSPPLHAVQPYQKTSTEWVGFQENRNYSRDPRRENLRRPAAKKKEKLAHCKFRARNTSRARGGHPGERLRELPLPEPAQIRKVVCTTCLRGAASAVPSNSTRRLPYKGARKGTQVRASFLQHRG